MKNLIYIMGNFLLLLSLFGNINNTDSVCSIESVEFIVENESISTIYLSEKSEILQVKNISNKLNLLEEKVLYYFELCQKNAEFYNLDVNMILAIIFVESHYNEKAESFLGSKYGRGLMQVSEIGLRDYNRIHKTNYAPKDLYNPETNIKVGTWIFYYNIHYGVSENYTDMLSAYNTGIGSWKKNIFNHDYVNKVENALDIILL